MRAVLPCAQACGAQKILFVELLRPGWKRADPWDWKNIFRILLFT
jgi:hypothetical protein